MAKGISQEQVNAAIDVLVAGGERPTIERVRAALGTGSPNTLTRMLEVWWAALGPRLAQQQRKVAMPEAPEAVATLASRFWEQALQSAQTQAHAALQGERAQLESERTQLTSERGQAEQQLGAQRQAVLAAQQVQAIAETRLVDAQRLAERHGQQLADVLRQRDALQARTDQLTEDLAALATRLQVQEAAAAAEREAHAQHVRSTEDRSHIEVDRARQETRELRLQHTALERERGLCEKQRDEARHALSGAQREATGQRARADALEQQLARLSELHATLQATLAKGRQMTPIQRAPSRKPAPAARKVRAPSTRQKLPAKR